MADNSMRTPGPYIALLAAVVFWGLSFIGTKIALQSITVVTLIFIRFSIASIFFVLLMFYKKVHRLTRQEHKKLVFLALIQPVLYFLFENYGVKNTGAATASLVIATIPIAVMILAGVVLKEKITPLKVFGISLSFVGILLLVYGDPALKTGNSSLWGIFCLVMAVVCGAVYSIMIRSISNTIPVIAVTGYQFIYGTIMLAPVMSMQLAGTDYKNIPVEALWAVLFLAVFSTIVAFLSYNYALSRIPASQAAVFLNAVPAVTVFGAWVYLQETITLLQVVAGIIIVLALYLANKPETKNKPAAESI